MESISIVDVRKKNRKFGLTMAVCFLVLFGLTYLRHGHIHFYWLGLSVIFLISSLVLPIYLTSLRFLWYKLGYILGRINSFVLLTILFIILVFPLGLLLRIFRKDLLNKKILNKTTSYWEVPSSDWKDDMSQQF